ncbi:MAG: pyroglutamyl-peptidase I [bacterium]|nr:pyroglutamyl-peptidase I [bacterium]
MKILVTGFEPWNKWDRNPSGEIAEALAGERMDGVEVVSTVLPVVHGEDIAQVVPLIQTHQPIAVVSLGLHGRASRIHVERVAINFKVVDGEDLPIVADGPAAYFATLPTREMRDAMNGVGVPAQLTYSAGTFLCNHVMYSVLHYLAEQGLDIPAGFLHLPPLPEHVAAGLCGGASMALAYTKKGVVAGLEAVVKNGKERFGVEIV